MYLRASLVFVSVIALLLPSAAAAANQPFRGSKVSATSDQQRDIIAGRQLRIKRDTGDNCVSISGPEFAERVNLVPDPAFKTLTVDTCKKDIESWLANDPNGQSLKNIMGTDAARTGLHTLFSGSPTIEKRQLPSLAKRQLEASAVVALKGLFGLRRRNLPIITLPQAKQTCKINESVCGIAGREDDSRAFECIDTQTSLDHCGGCVIPHPFYEPDRVASKGVECGRLPHVISAQCIESTCVVSKCMEGFELSLDKTQCVSAILETVVDRVSPIFHPVKREFDEATN
ncbi:hypothetical protein C0993_012128 [Termitomyces sp. T159_Od127]|nr:hypothetical protein C0993_012128 [Termitomyces sp. T159_Od127]